MTTRAALLGAVPMMVGTAGARRVIKHRSGVQFARMQRTRDLRGGHAVPASQQAFQFAKIEREFSRESE
jgi:hypothetical protein